MVRVRARVEVELRLGLGFRDGVRVVMRHTAPVGRRRAQLSRSVGAPTPSPERQWLSGDDDSFPSPTSEEVW